MKKSIQLLAWITLAVFVSIVGVHAEPADPGHKDLKSAIIGTWKRVSLKVDDRKIEIENHTTLKHVTPDGFVWLSYDTATGKIDNSGGGTWTLKGDSYTETIEYGIGPDFDVIKNASHTFTCEIDGNTWHHKGALANGQTIDETLERVKPSDNEKQEKK